MNPDHIDRNDADDVARWAADFDATAEQILEAIDVVGPKPPDVEMHLKGSRSTTNSERVADAGQSGN